MLENIIARLKILSDNQNLLRENIKSKGIAAGINEHYPALVNKINKIASYPSAASGSSMLFNSCEKFVIDNLPRKPKEIAIANEELFSANIYGTENSYIVPSISVEFTDDAINEIKIGECVIKRIKSGDFWRVELSFELNNSAGKNKIYFQGGKLYRWVVIQCITES